MAPGATLDQFKRGLPDKLDIQAHRQGGGVLIMEDSSSPDWRQQFLDLCLRQLRDQSFIEATGFRQAFFRAVEV
jgi:hypothetical protein